MHDEELHILFLRALVNHPGLEETDRIRPRHLLEMALKNHPGDVAADFTVVCRDGSSRRLSDIKAGYVLVYFNDPDCEDCRRVKELLSLSPVVNGLLESGRLKLLSVCVEGKTPAWEKAEFPAGWIDGYDAGQRLTREQVYDLKAMPTLYLLDAEKRVILKDASFGRWKNGCPETCLMKRSLWGHPEKTVRKTTVSGAFTAPGMFTHPLLLMIIIILSITSLLKFHGTTG